VSQSLIGQPRREHRLPTCRRGAGHFTELPNNAENSTCRKAKIDRARRGDDNSTKIRRKMNEKFDVNSTEK